MDSGVWSRRDSGLDGRSPFGLDGVDGGVQYGLVRPLRTRRFEKHARARRRRNANLDSRPSLMSCSRVGCSSSLASGT